MSDDNKGILTEELSVKSKRLPDEEPKDGCGCGDDSGDGCNCGGGDECDCGDGCNCGGEDECDCSCGDHGGGDKTGHFQGFVLLNSVKINMESIMRTLKDEWGIEPDTETDDEKAEDSCGGGEDCDCGDGEDCGCDCDCGDGEDCSCGCGAGEEDGEQTTQVFSVQGSLVAISLMPAPIPEGEAEYFAQTNYMWPESVAVTETHEAHILVAVMPKGISTTEAGKLFVKAVSACVKEENAIGVYTSGTVFQPGFYLEVADMMKDDEEALPILDWIYLGLYRTANGNNAYTFGLELFGREEIEILNSKKTLEELRDFLFQISCYIIEYDETLQDGETIGFTDDQRLPITRSKGVAVEGHSLKIEF